MEYERTKVYEADVAVPADLFRRIERRLPRTEFDSVDEYASYVLERVVSEVEDETRDEDVEEADREEVEARLESLGYLS